MADTPLVKKLGIKPGHNLLVLNAPQGYLEMLRPLPEGAEVKTDGSGTFDFVQVFVYHKADVEKYAKTGVQAVKPGGMLWFTYPKKTSKIKTDISRDEGWESVRAQGVEGIALISVDDTWSAMRYRPSSDVKSRRRG